MIHKKLIRPDRVRQVPPSFNWVDHRLVRDNYLTLCDCTSQALYLFLVTVCDVQGLSYYSDASHVGIYIGDGMMVHASTFGVPVRVAPVDNAPIYNVRRY